MVDYGLLPPEVNSGRIYTGPGSGPLLAAAAAWSALAADLQSAAEGHRSVISELTGGPWLGPASQSLLAAVTPFIAWLDGGAVDAEEAASQAFAASAAYEAAFAATVPPPVVAANRALLGVLVATNFFGQNTPAVAATEAQYVEFWAQDAAAMYNYASSSAAATQLAELPEPAEVTDPNGLVDQAVSAFKAQGQAIQNQLNGVGGYLAPRVGDLLKTLSSPLNGDGTAIDKWIVANTPFDDIVPLYSKYLSPYVSSLSAVMQTNLAFANQSSGFTAVAALANSLAPAADAAASAAQAAGSAAASAATKVGSITAGVGQGVSLTGLSVPASWTTSINAATGTGTTAISNATAIPAAAQGAAASNVPVAPPFGQFLNAGNGRKTPSYGFRLTFMTRPPAAG